MTERSWVAIGAIVIIALGSTALVNGQKGNSGKGKTSDRVPATVEITCPVGVDCGIRGDEEVYGPSNLAVSAPGATLNVNKEMNLVIGVIDGVSRSITLDFFGQRPEDLESAPSDCSSSAGTCLWNWNAGDQRVFSSGFEIQNNTLDELGEYELANGLLSIGIGNTTLTRFNMTITSAGDGRLWRFNYNPNIPPTGLADLAKVTRADACTWVFSALEGERAALSVIYSPPKGKSYVHHEGRFAMPFEMTFRVPSLCP